MRILSRYLENLNKVLISFGFSEEEYLHCGVIEL